jgi:hypothetical protein
LRGKNHSDREGDTHCQRFHGCVSPFLLPT